MNDIVAPTVRPKTFESYESIIRIHVVPAIGHIRLTRLRPDHLQALYTQKREDGYSERTVQYIHSVIGQSLNQAVKWGLVSRNVTNLVEPPRPQRKTPTTLTPEQARLFLKTIKDERLYPLYLLAITTGMRKGELLGLMWDDVDLDRGLLHIRRAAQRIWKKGIIITEPKSEASRRTILLSNSTKDILSEYKKDRFSDLVFPSPTGNPISGSNLRKHFNEALKRAGLPHIRFHDLRHTSATFLLAAGVHPKIVQERLGHSRISETLDTYSHVLPLMQQEAADEMETILGNA